MGGITIVVAMLLATPSAPIAGIVVDPDGKPVGQAAIGIIDGALRTTTTAADGTWRFDRVGAGAHEVIASAASFVRIEGQRVVTDGRAAATGVVVRVGWEARITGTVVDEAGATVAYARITSESATATADAAGRFTLGGLGATTHHVWAATPTRGSRVVAVTTMPRHDARVRLVVTRSSLAGTVVDRRGAPVAHAHVAAWSHDIVVVETTDDAGHFDLGGVPLAIYQLAAHRDHASLRDPITVTANERGIRFVLSERLR